EVDDVVRPFCCLVWGQMEEADHITARDIRRLGRECIEGERRAHSQEPIKGPILLSSLFRLRKRQPFFGSQFAYELVELFVEMAVVAVDHCVTPYTDHSRKGKRRRRGKLRSVRIKCLPLFCIDVWF